MSIQSETQTRDEIMEELWLIKDTLAASSQKDLEKLVWKMKAIAAEQKGLGPEVCLSKRHSR
ncbi:MAG: hypothetical protein O2954_03840 [bacterium]|nr:hypothetical protein [bacterium]